MGQWVMECSLGKREAKVFDLKDIKLWGQILSPGLTGKGALLGHPRWRKDQGTLASRKLRSPSGFPLPSRIHPAVGQAQARASMTEQ